MALFVGRWSFCLAKGRLAASPRLLLSFFLATLATSPHSPGVSPFVSSHAMVYNRYGYALVGLILMEAMARPFEKGGEWKGGFSTGVAMGLALFLKASFFFMAVGLIAGTALLLMRYAWQRLIGIVVGFSL